VVLVTFLAASCGQPNPGATSHVPSPVAAVSPLPSATPSATQTSTVEQDLGRCPSAAELASVDSSLGLTFASDPSAGRLVCSPAQGSRDLTLLQERSYQAILMFTWISFDAPLPWTNQTLDAWFAHAIKGIAFRDDGKYSYCCAPGGVIVIQTNNLYVLSARFNEVFAAVSSLAALFIHEARHNEGYLHTCSTGARAGQNDNTIAELGAWGVEYYFLLWLGTHPNPGLLSDDMRLASTRDAESMKTSFFCQQSPSPTT
jgi:hypothetical protein